MVLRLGHHRYIVASVSSGQWCAYVEFMVLNLAFSMVLGMPWSKAVGPRMEWSTGAVGF